MNKQTEALKMAIEALESAYGVLECEGMIPIGYESAIQACKEALAESERFETQKMLVTMTLDRKIT